MKKLVIFDLDGTLLNTIDDITNSINRALDSVKLARVTVDEAKYFVGSGVDILIDRLLRYELGEEYESKKDSYFNVLRKNYCDDYAVNNAIYTGPYPGIKELILKLKEKGIRVAVISNKPHDDTLHVIDKYFGLDLFDLVMGKMEHNRIKPYPDAPKEAIAILEERFSNKYKLADIVYVGDTNVDIETAKNIGCESIACSWGFRKIDELKEANYICDNTDEVYEIITKRFDGIIVLDKGEGISSNKVINDIKHTLSRNNFPISKIGHAGTLDPLATGVMVVLVNNATKLSDFLMCEEKEYECEIEFGKSYDTLDITGKLIDDVKLNIDDYRNIKNNIDDCLNSFLGESKQIPPMYSSIKQNGVKLYDLARNGESVEREERTINIKSIERISDLLYENDSVKFSFRTVVSKGTYIRSLCEDIGKVFGLPCAMSKLRRTRSGEFSIEEALTKEEIFAKNLEGKLELIRMLDAVKSAGLKIVDVDEFIYNRVSHGMKVRLAIDEQEVGIVYNDELIAIYQKTDEESESNINNKNSYKVKLIWN